MHVLHTTKVGTSWKLVKILHWKESGWNLSLFEYMFYLQPDKFKKPSSKSLLQLPSVGFTWEEGPLWQHCAAEIIIPSSSCLKALFARLADTVGVFFFLKSAYFSDFTRTVQRKWTFLTTVECAWWWRRVSERRERKAWKRASEKDWWECDERAEIWLGGICERVNESLLTLPSLTYTQPWTDGQLVYLYLKDHIFPPRLPVLLFSYHILTMCLNS